MASAPASGAGGRRFKSGIPDQFSTMFRHSPVALREKLQHILQLADVEVGGSRPWDILIHNDRFYQRVLAQGSLGLGESYMDGWWDCEQIDEMITKILKAELDKKVRPHTIIFDYLKARLFNQQTRRRAYVVGEKHYDIGNDLYERMLGKRLVYTCGYWQEARDLDEAQEAKLDLVCRKLKLRRGQRILDIGCGWGSFARFATEKYGVSVVGITISKEQVELGRKLCHGLPVEIRLEDYRNVEGRFDHIVSLGMIEHVGYKNYRTYMEVVRRCLKDPGLFLLQTIGGNCSVVYTDPWMERYIFPNSLLPTMKELSKAFDELFVVEDWHNFGIFYDKTLMSWFTNFDRSWPKLRGRYGDRFYRMWKYYLLSCAGAFRSRSIQLWQIVLSKKGVQGGYESVR